MCACTYFHIRRKTALIMTRLNWRLVLSQIVSRKTSVNTFLQKRQLRMVSHRLGLWVPIMGGNMYGQLLSTPPPP
jgi:hypothetical protein